MTHPIVQRVCTGEFGFDVGVLGGRAQDVEPGCGHGHPRFSSDRPHSATDSTGTDDDSTALASSLALRPASSMKSRFIFRRSTPTHFPSLYTTATHHSHPS